MAQETAAASATDDDDQLIKAHQVINMQTIEGKTPLFCAILSGDINMNIKKDIIKILFDSC